MPSHGPRLAIAARAGRDHEIVSTRRNGSKEPRQLGVIAAIAIQINDDPASIAGRERTLQAGAAIAFAGVDDASAHVFRDVCGFVVGAAVSHDDFVYRTRAGCG